MYGNKISMDAAEAFNHARPFKRSNTEVVVLPNVTIMELFGNRIAYKYNDPQQTLSVTTCGWETRTTKDRLRAIGVDVSTRNYQLHLNGVPWDGNLKAIHL